MFLTDMIGRIHAAATARGEYERCKQSRRDNVACDCPECRRAVLNMQRRAERLAKLPVVQKRVGFINSSIAQWNRQHPDRWQAMFTPEENCSWPV